MACCGKPAAGVDYCELRFKVCDGVLSLFHADGGHFRGMCLALKHVQKAKRMLPPVERLATVRAMSRFVEEPPVDSARGYFSQLCVLLTGVASGVVEPAGSEVLQSATYHMGRRDGYHVVVAHLSSSESLKEAADKCVAFGRGVEERAKTHPYGPDWCRGFSHATMDAADDIAMYAASGSLPSVDKTRLGRARAAARFMSPLGSSRPPRTVEVEPPLSQREW